MTLPLRYRRRASPSGGLSDETTDHGRVVQPVAGDQLIQMRHGSRTRLERVHEPLTSHSDAAKVDHLPFGGADVHEGVARLQDVCKHAIRGGGHWAEPRAVQAKPQSRASNAVRPPGEQGNPT